MSGYYMGIPRKEIPWYLTIDENLCNNCGNCLNFCDNDVFSQDNLSMKVVNPYNCVVGCNACAKDCPEGAISFPEKKELVQILKELRKTYST